MDLSKASREYPGMAKRLQKPLQRPRRAFRPLYIGEWIRALGKRPVDVVRGIQINEGYLSGLISGKKKNPSANMLAEIADFLGVPAHYFYRKPPEPEFLDDLIGRRNLPN